MIAAGIARLSTQLAVLGCAPILALAPGRARRGRPPGPDVSAHLDESTALFVALFVLVALFFCLRRELWRRLWFTRVDPRPLGLFRVAFGGVVLWAVLDLIPFARLLFSDEGLWLTRLARREFGGAFRYLWDPQHGFEHGYDLFIALLHGFSPLHVVSSPAAVYALIAVTLVAALLMTLGVWTRVTTVATWALVNALYCHNTVFYSGADTALRVFLFLGMFSRWGEAYAVDSWRRTRREVLAGATPTRRLVPAWPQRLMMIQLAIIYGTTGLLKTGHLWRDGTALYYATSLEHFFRAPSEIIVIAWLQRLWILPLATWLTLAWEIAFPVALVGCALRAYEDERRRGVWVGAACSRTLRRASYVALVVAYLCAARLVSIHAYYMLRRVGPWRPEPAQAAAFAFVALVVGGPLVVLLYRVLRRAAPGVLPWLLGRRVWLVWGVVFHLGIELLMNVGMFVQVMLAPYIVWFSGQELEGFWRYLASRPCAPGERGRPVRAPGALRAPLRLLDRLRHRAPRAPWIVRVGPDAPALRRAALLRPWDLGGRLRFVVGALEPGSAALSLELPDGTRRAGPLAGAALTAVFPGLWPLYPCARIPGCAFLVGRLVCRILGQGSSADTPRGSTRDE